MKRILYIQGWFSMGGINRITSVKESYLVNHGFEVHNLNCLDKECVSPVGLYDDKIIMHRIDGNTLEKLLRIPFVGRFLRFFYYRWALLSKILLINPDIVIVTQPFLEPLSVVLLSLWKKRIMEFHGWYNNPKCTQIPFREKFPLSVKYRLSTFVSLTQGEAKKLNKLLGANSLVIPNPQYNCPKMFSSCDRKRVISMARFCYQKSLSAILPSWKKVQEIHPDWELHLFGDGPDEDKMRSIIMQEKLTTVFIHPYTNQVEKELLNSSIYVFPSVYEGFGLVLFEAMSIGVPCVAYDCPFGPSEIIRNNEDGFLVEYMNSEKLMDKVLLLIENETLRKKMGVNARKNSLDAFNIDVIMKKWMSLFDDLLYE